MADDVNARGGKPRGVFRQAAALLRRQWRVVVALVGGGIVGMVAFGSWSTVIEHTNHTEFCINCHIMRDTVYQEYMHSAHYSNKHGVRVGCPDCHVPQYSWFDEAIAKYNTIGELFAFFVQGKNNAEALEKDRPELAKQVWAHFAETNARECKHCHKYDSMVMDDQKPSARVSHVDAAKKDQNCVECHKGLTHKPVQVAAPAAKDSDSFDVQ